MLGFRLDADDLAIGNKHLVVGLSDLLVRELECLAWSNRTTVCEHLGSGSDVAVLIAHYESTSSTTSIVTAGSVTVGHCDPGWVPGSGSVGYAGPANLVDMF